MKRFDWCFLTFFFFFFRDNHESSGSDVDDPPESGPMPASSSEGIQESVSTHRVVPSQQISNPTLSPLASTSQQETIDSLVARNVSLQSKFNFFLSLTGVHENLFIFFV